MKKSNKNKGITLISLIVTIVILLILAGVTIAQLTESGLFEKSKLSKEKFENSQIEENKILEEFEEQISDIVTSRENIEEDGVNGYEKLFTASLNNKNISSHDLKDFTMTQDDNFNKYFIYEDNYITCKKNGWYELCMSVNTYSSGNTGAILTTYLIIDSYSQEFTRSASVNTNARGYSDYNSKTIYLKEGQTISINKTITSYAFSTTCNVSFVIHKI